MKIYELVKKVNTKVSVKCSDVYDVKKYYLSMYRAYMVMLYDRGYISDPTGFDKKEIFKNIVDLEIKHITGVTGKIELSVDNVGFALAKNKKNPEAYTFLSLLLEAIKYRELSMNIDKFYDDCGISGSSRKKVSINTVQAASRIYFKSGYDLDEAVLKCLHGKEKTFKFVTLDNVIYETALKELGLDGIETEESLFVDGLSREEEIRYSSLILNGLVTLDGKYKNVLSAWLKKNKWAEGNKFSSQNEGLYNWVLYIKSNDAIEEQSKLLNSLIDEGYEVVGMKSNGFYVLDEVDVMPIPLGAFAIMSDYEHDEILSELNKPDGYTGEGYSMEFIAANEINFVGCPIEIYSKGCKKILFVDKEQTENKDFVSWFSNEGVSIVFDENFGANANIDETTVVGKLQKLLIEAERGNLVGQFNSIEYFEIQDSTKKAAVSILN